MLPVKGKTGLNVVAAKPLIGKRALHSQLYGNIRYCRRTGVCRSD